MNITDLNLYVAIPLEDYRELIGKVEQLTEQVNQLIVEWTQDMDALLTIKQCLKFLQCSKPTFYKLLRMNPTVKPIKFGERGVRYRRRDLLRIGKQSHES